jgi:kinesin family member 5
VQVRASYIQIYLENVKDLLAPSNQKEREGMKIRADTERGLWLPDATEVPVHSLMAVFAVLVTGAKNRKVAATKANEHSSRSHALLILTVQRKDLVQRTTKLSQMYLVDLAGSERVSKTDVAVGSAQLREAQLINKSLLALGNVISALAAASEKKGKAAAAAAHIPYRDSKLTRLLQNCTPSYRWFTHLPARSALLAPARLPPALWSSLVTDLWSRWPRCVCCVVMQVSVVTLVPLW